MNTKTALITGASRGIGAATALKLAAVGSNVALNYRNKAARALEVAAQIQALGVKALPVQADITNPNEVEAMLAAVQREFGSLDLLILNASGGMEKDKPEEYAMALNDDAANQFGHSRFEYNAGGRQNRFYHQPLGAFLWLEAGDG